MFDVIFRSLAKIDRYSFRLSNYRSECDVSKREFARCRLRDVQTYYFERCKPTVMLPTKDLEKGSPVATRNFPCLHVVGLIHSAILQSEKSQEAPHSPTGHNVQVVRVPESHQSE